VFRPQFGDRLDRGRTAGPTFTGPYTHPTRLLIFFYLACDPFPFALPGVITGSCTSQQSTEAAFENGVVHFALARTQRRVEYILLLGGKRTFDVYFETSEEEWTENFV
jgi:hypothetical protein